MEGAQVGGHGTAAATDARSGALSITETSVTLPRRGNRRSIAGRGSPTESGADQLSMPVTTTLTGADVKAPTRASTAHPAVANDA